MRKLVEMAVPREVIVTATDEIKANKDKFAERGDFDGSERQKVIGRIGEKMVQLYVGFSQSESSGLNVNGQPDHGDFARYGMTIDVKASFSSEYRRKDEPPSDWGLLIPESQWQYDPHDFYIRCAVNSAKPSEITKCCFVGVCSRKAVELTEPKLVKCSQPKESIVLMRVIKESWIFDIDHFKRYLRYLEEKEKWVRTGHS